MFTPQTRLRNIPPEVHETAANIAKMGRIVIQAFSPPELLVETEKRLFLTAVGEIQKLREVARTVPEGDAS
jgi:hypothetical protein